MESTKEMLGTLMGIGLNKYEAQVYLSLVTEGLSTAKNVSDITGIPYGKVYEIIKSLSTKGFCILLPTKPMKCKANSPSLVVNKAKDTINQKMSNVESYINQWLEPLFQKSREFSDKKGFFWVLNGRSNIIGKVQELINDSQKSISVYVTENGLKRLSIYKSELEKAKDRGISVNIGGPVTEENKEDVHSLRFCNIRHLDNKHMQIFSFDEQNCLIVDALPDDDSIIHGRDVAVWIINKNFTNFVDDSLISKFKQAKSVRL